MHFRPLLPICLWRGDEKGPSQARKVRQDKLGKLCSRCGSHIQWVATGHHQRSFNLPSKPGNLYKVLFVLPNDFGSSPHAPSVPKVCDGYWRLQRKSICASRQTSTTRTPRGLGLAAVLTRTCLHERSSSLELQRKLQM